MNKIFFKGFQSGEAQTQKITVNIELEIDPTEFVDKVKKDLLEMVAQEFRYKRWDGDKIKNLVEQASEKIDTTELVKAMQEAVATEFAKSFKERILSKVDQR